MGFSDEVIIPIFVILFREVIVLRSTDDPFFRATEVIVFGNELITLV